MIIYLCTKYESNTLIFKKENERKPFSTTAITPIILDGFYSTSNLTCIYSYLNYGYLRGSASMPWLFAPGSYPRVELEVKIKDAIKMWFLQMCFGTKLHGQLFRHGSWSFDSVWNVMKWRSACDLYFRAQWFCHISWWLFDELMWYFWDIKSVLPNA